jgi:hypothetical protein
MSLSRASDLMNRNRKRMKPKATCLTEYESATDFKGIEALQSSVLSIDDQWLRSDVQAEAGQIYDELRRLFETL